MTAHAVRSGQQPSAFPIFLDLADRKVLIVGNGGDAAGKLRLIAATGAIMTVVADNPSDLLIEAAAAADTPISHRRFVATDLDGTTLCFVGLEAAEDAALVVTEARRRGVLVNAVDKPALCDFIVPAIVDRAPVVIAIGTGGAAPALARELRRRIETAVSPSIGRLAALCRRWRGTVAARIPDPNQRRHFWDAVLRGGEVEQALDHDEAQAEAILERRLADNADKRLAGRVSLVGAGPGDPELLTLKAGRALKEADVVLYDSLVDPRTVAMARRGARLIDVGKRSGRHAMSQDAINGLIASHARQGAHVVRLKGGDPFIFGRGGEELLSLVQAGIAVEVVPGVTAACGAAAGLGIPLTHREMARSLHIITGHDRDGSLPDHDWRALTASGGTLAIYMGAKTCAQAVARLIAAGMAPDMPAVAIESASLPGQRHIEARLSDLPARLAEAGFTGPTLLLIGEVVGLRQAAVALDVAEAA